MAAEEQKRCVGAFSRTSDHCFTWSRARSHLFRNVVETCSRDSAAFGDVSRTARALSPRDLIFLFPPSRKLLPPRAEKSRISVLSRGPRAPTASQTANPHTGSVTCRFQRAQGSQFAHARTFRVHGHAPESKSTSKSASERASPASIVRPRDSDASRGLADSRCGLGLQRSTLDDARRRDVRRSRAPPSPRSVHGSSKAVTESVARPRP